MARTVKEHGPHPVDTHVGKRISLRRALLGITQQALASDIGVSFQQVQKYEKGANRVSASKLHEIARTLAVPMEYFFADYQESDNIANLPIRKDPMYSTECQELIVAYRRLSEKEQRSVMDLIKTIGTK